MKKVLTGVLVAAMGGLAFGACGGASPEQACDNVVAATCEKIFECLTGPALAAAEAIYGKTQAECVDKNEGNCANAQANCPANTSYDPNAAATCVNNYDAESCADVISAKVPPGCAATDLCH